LAGNEAQARRVKVAPEWICGDSEQLDKLLPGGALYDLVWTSPPYYDLEVYSDRGNDGSALPTYDEFMRWYRRIFKQAVARLRPNRFAVVKIGDVRDKRGAYRNFLGDNIACFRDLGLHFYNEAVLVTAVGSLPVRAGRQFSASRKLGRTHQNVLVFYKGDPRHVGKHFPAIEVPDDLDGGTAGEGAAG
jgi:DNA modification methylase